MSLSLQQLVGLLAHQGVTRAYAKLLAPNDNSKNQVYLGGDFRSLNLLPTREPEVRASGTSAKHGEFGRPIFAAALDFLWMDESGSLYPAPKAKLILYPQYPEVRFSGFLQGCARGPSELLGKTRLADRLLVLGVRSDGNIVGFVAHPESAVTREAIARFPLRTAGAGVLTPIPLSDSEELDGKALLLRRLGEVHREGWIPSVRLTASGPVPYNARNGGGYTLEARLGVLPNGFAEPDFHGWEVKQHRVKTFERGIGSPITLLTPEPNGGLYAEQGVEAFVRRFGYPDTRGEVGRWNFGGIHKVGSTCRRTSLSLRLEGYEPFSGKITNPAGGLLLIDSEGTVAASWAFAGLMAHWQRKHARAAYVPSMARQNAVREYRYGRRITLGEETDFLKLLSALQGGRVYYDPGIKVVYGGASPDIHRRSQFRVKSRDLTELYVRLAEEDVA